MAIHPQLLLFDNKCCEYYISISIIFQEYKSLYNGNPPPIIYCLQQGIMNVCKRCRNMGTGNPPPVIYCLQQGIMNVCKRCRNMGTGNHPQLYIACNKVL